MNVIIGYIASILIGLALGLIGGGGSILTLPVLVYLFGVDTLTATSYSLFIVGLTSAIGSAHYFKNGWVNIKTAIVFGMPSILAVFFTRAYLLPAIPNVIIDTTLLHINKQSMLMLLFAILMLGASYGMIKKTKSNAIEKYNTVTPEIAWSKYMLILLEGSVVGTLTGLVGAGGGFLIIPALVIVSRLPMKQAIGTSLLIIAAKSLVGFWAEPAHAINWQLLFSVSAFAVAGSFVGTAISKKIDGKKLKPAFGWFVLLMGIYIIVKETMKA